MKQHIRQWLGLGLSLLLLNGALAAEQPAADAPRLKHAVVCPPFKGDAKLAELYHQEHVQLLKASTRVYYLDASKAAAANAPDFTYRIVGAIISDQDGNKFIRVTLMDSARKEEIVSHIAPASTDPAAMAAWRLAIQNDLQRRVAKMPFECRVRVSARNQNSVTLDRGLDAGLKPGMTLYVSRAEEPIIDHNTGRMIGRDTSRPLGKIEVYRVFEHSAYARSVDGQKFPKRARLFAREF